MTTPAARPITDPKSLESLSRPGAQPIPIDDLFYTRTVVVPAWSPEGKEIAFATNLTGRLNLWKVDSFDRTAAALVSRGYVCIAPNPRGSTGYGLAFERANHQDLGGGDLEDEIAGAKFLIKHRLR